MNLYVATVVAKERLRDRRKESTTRRLVASRHETKSTRAGTVAGSLLLSMSRRLVDASNRLRAAGEQQYAVQACCTA